MEADLQRFYNIDYRDRWRGALTLRRIFALVRNLPPEAAVRGIERNGEAYWSLEAHLLDDLRRNIVGLLGGKNAGDALKPHPNRPKYEPVKTPEQRRKLADARKRVRERAARMAKLRQVKE